MKNKIKKCAQPKSYAPKNANPDCCYTNLIYFARARRKEEYAFLPKIKMPTLDEDY